jgi:hypothetical protein
MTIKCGDLGEMEWIGKTRRRKCLLISIIYRLYSVNINLIGCYMKINVWTGFEAYINDFDIRTKTGRRKVYKNEQSFNEIFRCCEKHILILCLTVSINRPSS